MRIAIFSDNFYPELSGISDSVILLAKELARLGHRVDFYVPEYRKKDFQRGEKELKLGKNITINRLFSLPAPLANAKARLVLPSLFRPTYKNFKADVIHSQLFFGVGLEALSLAKFHHLPLIGTNHTAITEFVKSLPLLPGLLKKPSLKYAVWYYNRCDFVTAPSQSVFSEMLKHGFKRPHRVVSNPLDIKTFCPLGERAKFKKQFKLSERAVVYVGRLSQEKNIDVIIKAAALARKKIADLNLAIAGAGKARVKLEELAKKLGLKNAVKFLGHLSHEKISQLYAASEIFAIASTSETQSLVLMQALACGLPAVAVNSRALPEYVDSNNGRLVPVGDVNGMAKQFVELLSDSRRRDRLSRGAVESASRFAAPVIAREWGKIYQQVIKNYRNKA